MTESSTVYFSEQNIRDMIVSALNKKGIVASEIKFERRIGEGGFGTHFDGATVTIPGRGIQWTVLSDGELGNVNYPSESKMWCSPNGKMMFRDDCVRDRKDLVAAGYTLRTFKEVK